MIETEQEYVNCIYILDALLENKPMMCPMWGCEKCESIFPKIISDCPDEGVGCCPDDNYTVEELIDMIDLELCDYEDELEKEEKLQNEYIEKVSGGRNQTRDN